MKSNFNFTKEAFERNQNRLVNQIYKLLPIYETEDKEAWQDQRSNVVLELRGFNELLKNEAAFMALIAKLFSLDFAEDQMIFRKTVFESITLLKEIKI